MNKLVRDQLAFFFFLFVLVSRRRFTGLMLSRGMIDRQLGDIITVLFVVLLTYSDETAIIHN